MPLRIVTSNRTEELLARLTGLLRESPPDPLRPEVIVVQSRGMEKWLSHRLAEELGCWAGFRFPFPALFVREVAASLGWEKGDDHAFDKEVLPWRVLGLLSDKKLAGFPVLRPFLPVAGVPRLASFQFARKVADTFDQYSLYRSDLLQRWSREEEPGDWQSVLWRLLEEGHGEATPAAAREWLLSRMREPDAPRETLPARVSVFGIPVLPRFHLDFFLGLSLLTQVDLYLFNPCAEYWHEIRRLKDKGSALTEEEWEGSHFEEVNRVLASLGRHGQRFHRMLYDDRPSDALEEEIFVPPDGGTLLSRIQEDILGLRDRWSPTAGEPLSLPPDRSLTFHSCHGPRREAEVLHDQLLGLLAGRPDLAPNDILIMCPDAETYAPYIQAAFGDGREGGSPRIPVSVADQSSLRQNRPAATFLSLLDFPRQRFRLSAVLDLIEDQLVSRRFGLDEEGCEAVRRWTEGTRIRWGFDARERAEAGPGIPPFSENSWRAGLDRLLLGYALAPGADGFVGEVLPWGDLEGKETEALGRLCHLLSLLRNELPPADALRTPAEWAVGLKMLAGLFLQAGEEDEEEMARLLATLDEMGEATTRAGFTGKVGLEVVRHDLEKRLGEETPGRPFLEGKATFCSLLPMRSLPFKVIALVGMNDGEFPRRDTIPSFSFLSPDRPGFEPRFGDRSLRDEDRYLFLETLLSAREALVVTWTGQSLRDGTDIPPSVVVADLVDAVREGYLGEDPPPLVTRHHLQAFDSRYFDGGSPAHFSFSPANLEAARAAQGGREPQPFVPRNLSPGEPPAVVPLADLHRFFRNPASWFLKQALEIRLEKPGSEAEDKEPLTLDHLEEWQLRKALVERSLAAPPTHGLEEQVRILRGEGRIPFAPLGEALVEGLSREVREMREKIGAFTAGNAPAPFPVLLPVAGITLSGELADLFPAGLLRWTASSEVTPFDRLSAWIDHLALCASEARPGRAETFLVATEGEARFPALPREEAGKLLAALVGMYLEGRARPLFFAPKTSWAILEGTEKARGVWEDDADDDRPGEAADPSRALCFRDADPLVDAGFLETARAVFGPLRIALGMDEPSPGRKGRKKK